MSAINVIYGYKIFSYILIPKKYHFIPKISENDYSIIMSSYFKEVDSDIIKYIENMIINQINNTNEFFIYLIDSQTNYPCLNEITNRQNVNIIINQTSIEDLSYPPDMINNILKIFIKKNIFKFQQIIFDINNINQINIDDFNLEKIIPQPIQYVLVVPYLFYRNNRTFNKLGSNIWSILAYMKINFEKPLNILFKINKKNHYNYENSKYNEKILTHIGNWRLFTDLIDIIMFMDERGIIFNFCYDFSLVKHYDTSIKKIFIYSTLNKHIDEMRIQVYNKILNKNITNSDIVLNGNLSVNYDDKLILKHIFDKSILPLSENIGQVKTLLMEPSDVLIFTFKLDYNFMELIFDAIIKKINSLCRNKDFENKKFIIKDANGSLGVNISGFNCQNYDRISIEVKKYFIIKLFEISADTNIQKILNTYILVQEFISSPTISIPDIGLFKFKSRIYILLEQNPDLTINFHLNKNFNIDMMNNFNSDEFFNIDFQNYEEVRLHSNQFISNHKDDVIMNVNKDYGSNISLLEFDYDNKLRLFITKFANQFSKSLEKIKKPLFTDIFGNTVNKKIFKILVVDAIFDENDNNDIKILEINTVGGIYDYFPNVYEYIIQGRLQKFHSIFSVKPDELSTSKKYLSKIIKVKINYDQV
jgi:hypothetical protein